MTGARLTATFDDAAFSKGVAQLRRLMRDTTPITRVLGARLAANTEDRLGGTTAPDGSQWPALSPAYAAMKREPGMLKVRGAQGGLLASITFYAGHNQVVVGSNKIYAAIHQFGGPLTLGEREVTLYRRTGKDGGFAHGGKFVTKGKSNFSTTHTVWAHSFKMPARPYLGLSAGDRAMITEVVDGFYRRALGTA